MDQLRDEDIPECDAVAGVQRVLEVARFTLPCSLQTLHPILQGSTEVEQERLTGDSLAIGYD